MRGTTGVELHVAPPFADAAANTLDLPKSLLTS